MLAHAKLRSGNFWLGTITIALLLGLILWQWRNVEWQREQLNTGWSQEALLNPLLAAEHLLEAHYPLVTARSFRGLEQLQVGGEPLAKDHTLLLNGTFHTLSASEVEALWSWLDRGGHLIAVVYNPNIPPQQIHRDALLTRLGLSFHRAETEPPLAHPIIRPSNEDQQPEEAVACEATDKTEGEKTEPDITPYLCRQTTTDIAGPNTPPVEVALSTRHYFERANPELTAGAQLTYIDQHLALLRQPVGAGRITLLNHSAPFSNLRIGCADHAFALLNLVGDSEQVWLMHNRSRPSLMATLWAQIPAVLVAGLLALLLWLWFSARRFGPVHQAVDGGRRNFMAHIEASAHFLWRRGRTETLCKTLRQDILKQLNQRQSNFHRLTRAEQIRQVAQHCQVSEALVEQTLFGEIPAKTGAFVNLIQSLQQIRNRI